MGELRRVVITGGAGFIGSCYVRQAAAAHEGWHIVVLDKLTYAGNLENLKDVSGRIEFIQGDIAEPDDVRKALAGADAVVNFAAESHVDRSLLEARAFVRTNVEGTLCLLEEARRVGVKRFVQVSTDEIYGDLSGTTRHSMETDAPAPRSPYAATKAAAEHVVFSYGISYGMDVVVTRGSNTYGPYQYPEKIIPLFITNAIEGKPMPVYGRGLAVRDYMHVEDHAAGIDAVLHKGQRGWAYNLGAGLEVPGIDVARRIAQLSGRGEELIHFVADRPGHDYRYSVDSSRANALGWSPRWNWTDGLAATFAWYRDHQDWWREVKSKREFLDHQAQWYGRK